MKRCPNCGGQRIVALGLPTTAFGTPMTEEYVQCYRCVECRFVCAPNAGPTAANVRAAYDAGVKGAITAARRAHQDAARATYLAEHNLAIQAEGDY